MSCGSGKRLAQRLGQAAHLGHVGQRGEATGQVVNFELPLPAIPVDGAGKQHAHRSDFAGGEMALNGGQSLQTFAGGRTVSPVAR